MSIFASRTTKTIPFPTDADHTVTLQAMPGRKLQKARQESIIASADQFRRMGGAAMQKELKEIAADKKTTVEDVVEAAKDDPAGQYDTATVLKAGVKAWSLPEDITDDTLDDLSDDVAETLKFEILKLTKPSLFQSKSEQEADRKNG